MTIPCINLNKLSSIPTCFFYENSRVRQITAYTLGLSAALAAVCLYNWPTMSTTRFTVKVIADAAALLCLVAVSLPCYRTFLAKRALQAPSLSEYIAKHPERAKMITVTPELQRKLEKEIPKFEDFVLLEEKYGKNLVESGWVTQAFVQKLGVEYICETASDRLNITPGRVPVHINKSQLPDGVIDLISKAKSKVKSLQAQAENQRVGLGKQFEQIENELREPYRKKIAASSQTRQFKLAQNAYQNEEIALESAQEWANKTGKAQNDEERAMRLRKIVDDATRSLERAQLDRKKKYNQLLEFQAKQEVELQSKLSEKREAYGLSLSKISQKLDEKLNDIMKAFIADMHALLKN